MNVEEMGPPAPLHQHATPTEIAIMLVVVVLIAALLHFLLKRPTAPAIPPTSRRARP